VLPLSALQSHQPMEPASASPPAATAVGATLPSLEPENGARGEYGLCVR
jgi:hypothetical protein